MKRLAVGLLAVTLVLVGACSSPSTSNPSGSGSTGDPVAQAAPKPAAPKTAEEVTNALIQRVSTAKLLKTYTAADDPNSLLGRPNGYTSKTAFLDSRVPADKVEAQKPDAVERGGSIEVFADEAAAKARMKLIQEVSKGMPGFLGEYDYVSGGVLVRVSRYLTPDQAKEYETALAAIFG